MFQNLTAFTTATAVIDTTQFKLANAKEFKSAWTAWASAHRLEIAEEVARLASTGYTGDALDKMFKTCRYYITNRIASRAKAAASSGTASGSASGSASSTHISTVKIEAVETETENDSDATESIASSSSSSGKKKRAYIPIDKSLLESMDQHIIMAILNADDEETSPKPSECYAEFCSRFHDLIAAETTRLLSSTPSESAISEKLKKTYKNRMFIVHRAHA